MVVVTPLRCLQEHRHNLLKEGRQGGALACGDAATADTRRCLSSMHLAGSMVHLHPPTMLRHRMNFTGNTARTDTACCNRNKQCWVPLAWTIAASHFHSAVPTPVHVCYQKAYCRRVLTCVVLEALCQLADGVTHACCNVWLVLQGCNQHLQQHSGNTASLRHPIKACHTGMLPDAEPRTSQDNAGNTNRLPKVQALPLLAAVQQQGMSCCAKTVPTSLCWVRHDTYRCDLWQCLARDELRDVGIAGVMLELKHTPNGPGGGVTDIRVWVLHSLQHDTTCNVQKSASKTLNCHPVLRCRLQQLLCGCTRLVCRSYESNLQHRLPCTPWLQGNHHDPCMTGAAT